HSGQSAPSHTRARVPGECRVCATPPATGRGGVQCSPRGTTVGERRESGGRRPTFRVWSYRVWSFSYPRDVSLGPESKVAQLFAQDANRAEDTQLHRANRCP